MLSPRGLIACSMVEDEVNDVLERLQPDDLRVVWVERGYHNDPDKLRAYLQGQIDLLEGEGCREVLLAYGLCGRGAEGLVARRARLAMPRFDDCLNFMLCTGAREERALCRAGVMYLTRGWCQDQGALLQAHERYVEKYGERRGDRVMHRMFESYTSVCVIDTGCYDLEPVRDYARECARLLGLSCSEVPGGNRVLEKLIAGDYDGDIVVCEPGVPVAAEDFEV